MLLAYFSMVPVGRVINIICIQNLQTSMKGNRTRDRGKRSTRWNKISDTTVFKKQQYRYVGENAVTHSRCI